MPVSLEGKLVVALSSRALFDFEEENRVFEDRDDSAYMALQLERLRWSLQHAYDNVAHYRAKFDAAGVRPADLKTLADLAKFPFTTKQDLRETYPFGMFAVPREKVVRVHASSGTTGKPTVVGYTQQDIDTWANLMARSIHAAGGRPGHKVHVSYGYGLFTGGLGAHYGAERLGCTVIPFGGGQTERQVQLIQDFKPTMIVGTPSYVMNIIDEFERQGLDPAACIMVEDSALNLRTAKRLGMKTVLVSRSLRTPAHVDLRLQSVLDLPRYLGRL